MSDIVSFSSRVTQRGRTSDWVLQELRRMIITLELPPGAVVTEESLCALLGCSRTPLREAFQLLAREHLVIAMPRRGVSIAELGIVQFGELAEAHESIESDIARRAAERITDEQIGLLDQVMVEAAAAEAAGELARIVDLDFQTHTIFGAAAGNRFLLEFQETLLRLLARYVYLGFRRAGTASGAIDDHRHIVEALRGHDPDVVEAAVRTHIHNGRNRMRAAL